MNAELRPEPSVGELLTALARSTGTLVQQELQLAKTEVTGKARAAARDVGAIQAGGALAHAGVLTLVAALVVGLSSLVPVWASALVVGVIFTSLGYVLLRRGMRSFDRIDAVPRQTVQAIKEDRLWMKEQLR
jgi:uncharacterized membrane protein